MNKLYLIGGGAVLAAGAILASPRPAQAIDCTTQTTCPDTGALLCATYSIGATTYYCYKPQKT